MKTISLILSTIIALTCVLTGCSSVNDAGENTAPVIAELSKTVSDGASSLVGDTDDSFASFEDATAKSEITVTFLGEEYKGTYKRSQKSRNQPLTQTDIYSYEKGNFSVDHDSGEIVDIITWHCSCDSYIDGGKAPYTIDDGRKIADELAKKYLKNFSDFSVDEEYKDTGLYYRYSREIEGVKTSEHLAISVCQYHGEITGFHTAALNVFENDKLHSRASDIKALKDASDKLIDEKIKSEFGTEKYYDGYEVNSETLIRLEDGDYGIFYAVAVNHSEPMEDGMFAVSGELVYVTVKYDKPASASK